jgi:Domain of unknown function (DUF3883)
MSTLHNRGPPAAWQGPQYFQIKISKQPIHESASHTEIRTLPVKTTAYAKETPFFISDGELSFANSHELEFRLYRVFEFRRAPRLFELRGRPDRHCRLDPTTYRASFS